MAVEHIESDPFHLQTTDSDALILGEFYNENSYIYQNTFKIEQERTSYGTTNYFASTLYLKTNSLRGTTATFEKDVSLLHTYHKYTGSSMNATVIRLRDGSSAKFNGNLDITMHSATQLDPSDPQSSVMVAQGIIVDNSSDLSTELSVDGKTTIVVDNAQYANLGVMSGTQKNSSVSRGSFGTGIFYTFGKEGSTSESLNITTRRGRNAIGIYFKTKDTESTMTVNGDTVLSSGMAAKMSSDKGSSVYPETNFSVSTLVDTQNGDIANIGLWNSKGNNVFNGHVDITLFAGNNSNSLNLGIVSDGGTVTIADGLTVNAYQGEEASSERIRYDSNQLRAIQLLNGGSLKVSSVKHASVIRSNIYIRGENNQLDMQFDREDSLLEGNLVADNPNGDVFDTGKDNQTRLAFSNGAQWTLDCDNSLSTLEVGNDGTVSFRQLDAAPDTFRTLTVGTLSGTTDSASRSNNLGKFELTLDASAPNRSDKIIADTHTGSHIVDFNLIGGDTDSKNAVGTVFAEIGDEQGEFVGAETEGKLFWTAYDVAQKEESGKTLWYINAVEQPQEEETTTTTVTQTVSASNYLMWRQENELVRDRLGELRDQATKENPSGLWVRASYGQTGHKGNSGFEADYTRFQIGYDQRFNPEYQLFGGIAFDYRNGDVDFNCGSANSDSYGLSAYLTAYTGIGTYIDTVLRYSWLHSDLGAHDTNMQYIGLNNDTDAVSASMEIGHRFLFNPNFYLEPHLKITVGDVFSSEEDLSNGVHVAYDNVTSVVGRAGLTLGAKVNPNWQFAVKGSVLKEFRGEFSAVATTENEKRQLSEDYGDTWYLLGLDSTYAFGDNVYIYGTAVYETGSDLKDGFAVTGGLRWAF